jgi:phosphate transport system protein
MSRVALERELQHLQSEILRLGSEVEDHLTEVVHVLRRRDRGRSQALIRSDEWVNELRVKIGMDCLKLIALQQPAAGDMRLIAAMIEIAGELERIHDYIKGIAKINLLIDETRDIDHLVILFPEMAEKARNMLHQALDAFTERDADLARQIPALDNDVDELYREAYQQILNFLAANPHEFEDAHRLEWAAHNLERSADRVINICEWVAYMVTGIFVELDWEVKTTAVL